MRALAMLERLAGHVSDAAQGAKLSQALLPLAAIKTVRCALAWPCPSVEQKPVVQPLVGVASLLSSCDRLYRQNQ